VRAMHDSTAHVLIVDDDVSIREALTAALEHAYVVHVAASGAEACDTLQCHPIAAIVLEVVLDREHGMDLIERFRTLSQAPILILTGHGSEEVAVGALRAKVSEYLKKPVSLLEFRAALARLTSPAEGVPDPVDRARRLIQEGPGNEGRC
jgi:DNA-binding response OmpR family regulator